MQPNVRVNEMKTGNLGQVILHMATHWVGPMHTDGARYCIYLMTYEIMLEL